MSDLDGKLTAKWSKREKDIIFDWDGKSTKSDASLLNYILCTSFDDQPSFVDELQSRGYDITTLKFSIQKKKDS